MFGVGADELFKEHAELKADSKALFRGVVKNKIARHNLCYAEQAQAPAYDQGKGTVVPFAEVPLLARIRDLLPTHFGFKAQKLNTELNVYYDINKCGIGFHGDAERKRVIAIRLGASIPLHFQWFHRFDPVGDRIEFELRHGDMYVMSEKATGFDWRKSSQFTLRHAAGCPKYTKIKTRKKKKKKPQDDLEVNKKKRRKRH